VIRKKDSSEKGLKLLTSLRQHSTKLENTLFLEKEHFFEEKRQNGLKLLTSLQQQNIFFQKTGKQQNFFL
jgi:hypothetical protein